MNCQLIVAGIASDDNDADPGTRNHEWSTYRLKPSWQTAMKEMEGAGRQGFNPKACPISHWMEETELRDDVEDDDTCELENLSSEISNLFKETDLV